MLESAGKPADVQAVSQLVEEQLQKYFGGFAALSGDCSCCSGRLKVWAAAFDSVVDKYHFAKLVETEAALRHATLEGRVLKKILARAEQERQAYQMVAEGIWSAKCTVERPTSARPTSASSAFRRLKISMPEEGSDLFQDDLKGAEAASRGEEEYASEVQPELAAESAAMEPTVSEAAETADDFVPELPRAARGLSSRIGPASSATGRRPSVRASISSQKEERARDELDTMLLKQQLHAAERRAAELTLLLGEKEVALAEARGERAAMANSDVAGIAAWIECQIKAFDNSLASQRDEEVRQLQSGMDLLAAKARHAIEVMQHSVELSSAAVELPEMWSLTLDQLLDFHREIEDDLAMYTEAHELLAVAEGERRHICREKHGACECEHQGAVFEASSSSSLSRKIRQNLQPLPADTNLVVERYIVPATTQHGYALLKNPGGRKAEVFVSHVWTERFSDFVSTLEHVLKGDDSLWIAAFALPQQRAWRRALGADIMESAFVEAMQSVHKFVVVVDASLDVFDRAWCSFELAVACRLEVPVVPWLAAAVETGDCHKKAQRMDIRFMVCSQEEDNTKIQKAIRDYYEDFTEVNNLLRLVYADRIRLYVEAEEDAYKVNDPGGISSTRSAAVKRKDKLQSELQKAAKQVQRALRAVALKREGGYDVEQHIARAMEPFDPAILSLVQSALKDKRADFKECEATLERERILNAADRHRADSSEASYRELKLLYAFRSKELEELKKRVNFLEAQLKTNSSAKP